MSGSINWRHGLVVASIFLMIFVYWSSITSLSQLHKKWIPVGTQDNEEESYHPLLSSERNKTDTPVSIGVLHNQDKEIRHTPNQYGGCEDNHQIYSELPNLEATTFSLYAPKAVENAKSTVCDHCDNDSCREQCQAYEKAVQYLQSKAVNEMKARLHVIPIDPLAWGPRGGSAALEEAVSKVKGGYHYRTFKGSDHVFLCMSPGCSEVGERLSARLANDMGSRSIFGGIEVDQGSIKWPCPLRLVSVAEDRSADVVGAVEEILLKSTALIEGRNRWECSDPENPPIHWPAANNVCPQGFGFSLCSIFKSGSTMNIVFLRRLMHFKDWKINTPENTHGSKTGLLSSYDLDNEYKKDLVKDLSYVHGVIVRHPVSRLLSGYLNKIKDTKQYDKAAGLENYVKSLERDGQELTFEKFVKFLVEEHPDRDRLDNHFKPQFYQCDLQSYEHDFVGKLERLYKEFKEFGESLGFWDMYGTTGWGDDGSEPYGNKARGRAVHKSASKIWEHYTEELLWTVYKYYEEDFKMFGYTVEEILETKPADNDQSTNE